MNREKAIKNGQYRLGPGLFVVHEVSKSMHTLCIQYRGELVPNMGVGKGKHDEVIHLEYQGRTFYAAMDNVMPERSRIFEMTPLVRWREKQ